MPESKKPVEVTAEDLADEEWGPVKSKKGKKGKGGKGAKTAAEEEEAEGMSPHSGMYVSFILDQI